MKVVIVGGVAGGASVAARVRRIDEQAEIKVFERGEFISYSNCSLPYYLGGLVESAGALVMMTPERFKAQHNVDVFVNSEVTAIHRDRKTVTVKDVLTGEKREESYDKLVLAPGASPIMPKSIKGIDRDHVFSIRGVGDVVGIENQMRQAGTKNVVVVGGGFIGVETAENLVHAGVHVSLIEGLGQIMAPFDDDMVQILHKCLMDHGIDLYLNSTVTAIEDGHVVAEKDGVAFEVPAETVIMAIGVAPETRLAVDAGLEIGATRGIKVNRSFQTTDPDIYAVGDAVEIFNRQTGKPGRLALAGPAQMEARIAAGHMYGSDEEYQGFIGSSCIRIFELNAASTGLNEKTAAAAGIACDNVLVFPSDSVGIMPNSNYMAFKLIFEVPSGKILGAQSIGTGDADKRIDAIAALISRGGDIKAIKEYEHCYAPLFSTAKDVVHMAGLVAENILTGKLKQVHVCEVRGLVENGAFIVDVREPGEYAAGHLKTAVNIPLSQFRGRLSEIPKDVPVYLHCRSSQRSYYAYRCLVGNGYENVKNISGSYLGISLYEYFRDVKLGREPIMTAYNFD